MKTKTFEVKRQTDSPFLYLQDIEDRRYYISHDKSYFAVYHGCDGDYYYVDVPLGITPGDTLTLDLHYCSERERNVWGWHFEQYGKKYRTVWPSGHMIPEE